MMQLTYAVHKSPHATASTLSTLETFALSPRRPAKTRFAPHRTRTVVTYLKGSLYWSNQMHHGLYVICLGEEIDQCDLRGVVAACEQRRQVPRQRGGIAGHDGEGGGS